MKKIASILLSGLMIFNLLIFVIAKEDGKMVQLHSCDGKMGAFEVDYSEKVEGEASLSHTFRAGANSFANQVAFDPINAEGTDALVVEIYVSDPDIFRHMTQLCIEITSSGTCDHQENAWHSLHSVLQARELEPGWNTVYFYIEESTLTDGKCDLSAINYLRVFAEYNGSALAGECIKFDNFRMEYTGGVRYEFDHMDYYLADNSDVSIRIAGQTEPDLTNRHADITINAGLSK